MFLVQKMVTKKHKNYLGNFSFYHFLVASQICAVLFYNALLSATVMKQSFLKAVSYYFLTGKKYKLHMLANMKQQVPKYPKNPIILWWGLAISPKQPAEGAQQ